MHGFMSIIKTKRRKIFILYKGIKNLNLTNLKFDWRLNEKHVDKLIFLDFCYVFSDIDPIVVEVINSCHVVLKEDF